MQARANDEDARAIGDFRHGLETVHQQVDDDLLQSDAIAVHQGQVWREIEPQRHAMAECLVPYKRNGLLDDVADVEVGHLWLGFFGKLANSADHIAGAIGIANDARDGLKRLVDDRRIPFQPAQAGFAMRDNRRQRLVHFMRDRCAHLAQRRYAGDVSELRLGGMQRRLRMLGRRDVVIGFEDRYRPLPFVALQRPAAGDIDLLSGFARVNELTLPTTRARKLC